MSRLKEGRKEAKGQSTKNERNEEKKVAIALLFIQEGVAREQRTQNRDSVQGQKRTQNPFHSRTEGQRARETLAHSLN